MVSDDADNNCRLAGFSPGCKVLVVQAPMPLTGLDEAAKEALFTDDSLSSAGVGYYDCDGSRYWTIIAE